MLELDRGFFPLRGEAEVLKEQYLETREDDMGFADETDDYGTLFYCFVGVFDLEYSTLRGAVGC